MIPSSLDCESTLDAPGGVRVEFRPRLTAAQEATVAELISEISPDLLKVFLKRLEKLWGVHTQLLMRDEDQ